MQVESLGRYRIERELGRGAMGRVFLAYDPEIDRRVAVKTVQVFSSLPDSERTQARDRFLREARSAGKLLHPGIVTIFDVGEADGAPYLAMEFVEGQTLDAYCRDGTLLPVPVVVALLSAAAEALGFAHDRGIVHRDIKPANLMRVGDRSVKIMDFGIAREATASMTKDGALVGTPNYMAPEQVRGESLDGRTDLFSLAVVCFEMLMGERPFGGDSISSVLYRIVNEPPKDSSIRPDRIAPPLARFLDCALAKNPEGRYRDGASFAAALRQAGASAIPPAEVVEGAHVPAPTSTPGDVPRIARSKVPWIVAAFAGALMLGSAIVLRVGPFAPPRVLPLRARVRTEPVGLPIRLNAALLNGQLVEFPPDGPFGVLSASQGCREAKHLLTAADAGGEIVLVLDPARAEVSIDPGLAGARVAINGQDVGVTPVAVDLDLCRENSIEVRAEGYRAGVTTIPARAMPLEARSVAGAIKLEVIPTGKALFPSVRFPVEFFIDGKTADRRSGGIELPAGQHDFRATNDDRFVDVMVTIDVPAGGTVTPQLSIPPLARLVVQTFPPNCRVAMKRSGGAWRPLGESPLRHDLVAGRYSLRVESPASGEFREQDVTLVPGTNAPFRVSFGRTDR